MATMSVSSVFGYKPLYSQVSALSIMKTFNAQDITVTTITNAGTFTAAQALGGFIFHAGTAGALTTPTAAQLVAAMQGCRVNTSFQLNIRNTGSANSTITAGAGVTLDTAITLGVGENGTFLVVVNDNRVGSEAVTFVIAVISTA